MPAPNNPLVCKLALVYNRDVREFINTFHFYKSGGWTAPDMLALALLGRDFWQNFLRARVPDVVRLVAEQVRLLDPDNPLAVDHPEPGGIPGILGTPAEAANVTLALSKRTAYAGRKYRGRIYVPSLAEADVTTQDIVASAAVFAFSAAMQALIDMAVANGTPLVLFHKNDNSISTVTTFVVEALVDSMRRRLQGRGV